METSEKPLHGRGIDVTIESKAGHDQWASNHLRDIGNAVKPHGTDYMGSFATHCYAVTNIINVKREVIFIHQQVGGLPGTSLAENTSEGLMSAAFQDLMRFLRQTFNTGYKPKTLNPLDKR